MSAGWGFGGWFGGGAASRKEAPKKAILSLRAQLEMLSKREKHLENQINEQDGIARKYVSTNKNAAKAALRRKKQFEHALDQTQGQIMSLEREIHSIETANINKETLEAMKNASKAMKEIHGGLTIDKVDQTMEDLREQHAIGEEIGEAITQSIATPGYDETELEDELEALQQEALDDKLMQTGHVPKDRVDALPTAPEGVKGKATAVTEDDEEEELRKLQAEMAM
ncbi:Snf7-domain-containing protein [Microthyrium microscopicum]|uniref:Vacuolar-sorting protein SNF7 n=1 Tax=Microthyrium microscopicum TaxID=703497 RepID=A0A6A6ULP1_9PEZI|nr:Snf7-domain-containing protein [Microthyrium microscopicum]